MARFAAFHHAGFRRFALGQLISSIGSWLQAFAITWLVLERTGRSDRLGVAVALQFLPLLVLGAPAGLLADRVDNRRLLLATSAAAGTVALLFGLVVSSGSTDLLVLYGLTLLSGLVLAVERPAMQALVFQLVGRDDLPSAVAATSNIASVSRLVGPALGGAMVAATGVASCFYANSLSYVAVAAALAGVRDLLPRPLDRRSRGRLRAALADVRHRGELRRPLVVMAVIGLVVLNFQTTFPAMVRFGFGGGAGAVGMAMSVSAIGSILGGFYAAGVGAKVHRAQPLVLAGFAVVLAAVAAAPGARWFVVLSVPLGFASAAFQSINTAAVQQATDPAMQGRVMALHQMAWFGSTPIGALLMGWLIQTTSPRLPFALGGVTALACAAVLSRPAARFRARHPGTGDGIVLTAQGGAVPPTPLASRR